MNKNIRRSIVIAAGVSGAWALGSAVASADEVPAHSVSVPDRPLEAAGDIVAADAGGTVAQVTQAAHGTVTQAAHGAVPQVAHGAVGHVAHAAHVTQTAQGAAGHAVREAHGAVAHPVGAVHGAVDGAVSAAHEQVAEGQGAAHEEIDYLFGPLSAFAPDLHAGTTQAQAPVTQAQAPASHQAAAPTHTPAQAELPAQAQTPVQAQTPAQAQAPAQVRTLAAALGDGSGRAVGGGQRTFAAEEAPGGGLTQAVPVALQVVGDALYIGQGVQADVLAGRLPDNVPADTVRLIDHLVTGLSGLAGGGVAPGQAPGA